MALTTYCAKDLTIGSMFDCTALPVKGFKPDAVIINRNDIDFDSITMQGTVPGSIVLATLPLKTGARAHAIIQASVSPFSGTQISMEQGTFMNTFNKELHLIVFAQMDTGVAYITDALAQGEFVVVLRRKSPNGNTEYPIFGLDSGLKATEITQDFYSDDTNGAVAVTLTEEDAPLFERFLRAGTSPGTVEDTEALLAAMIDGE